MRALEDKNQDPYAGSATSYGELIDSMEYNVLLEVRDDDYQGASRLLFEDGTRFGLLFFGWGSRTGCDALEACDTHAEIVALRDDLVNDILWFDSKEEALAYISGKDWELQWLWHSAETKEFIVKAKEILAA